MNTTDQCITHEEHLQYIQDRIESSLDFILSHFEAPLFPRTISTKTTEGKQLIVYSKEEVLARFKQAEYLDCRINAFPAYKDECVEKQESNFIFIDIDRINLGVVSDCLEKIDKQFGKNVQPTVLFTGKGYHIYLPIEGIVLEKYSDFNYLTSPSQDFLKFAAWYLSNKNSDKNNNPSFKSCLLRVPETINSKCMMAVEIIQQWNQYRPSIKSIICSFSLEMKCKRVREQQIQETFKLRQGQIGQIGHNSIEWIETLLQVPLDDYRKTTIALILAPYLVTIKNYNFKQTHETISSWLAECSKARRLDFNPNARINDAISRTIQKQAKPMKFSTLKNRNETLYNLVLRKLGRAD